MKIIFIDIDGVLNTARSVYATGSQETWDPVACKYLQVLLDNNPDLKLVVSSTWRVVKQDCLAYFFYNGFKPEHFHTQWKTPILKLSSHRGLEIQVWLKENPVDKYCILDDNTDILQEQAFNFIHINERDGITATNMEKLENMLDIKDDYFDKISHIVEFVHEGYYRLNYTNHKVEYKYI